MLCIHVCVCMCVRVYVCTGLCWKDRRFNDSGGFLWDTYVCAHTHTLAHTQTLRFLYLSLIRSHIPKTHTRIRTHTHIHTQLDSCLHWTKCFLAKKSKIICPCVLMDTFGFVCVCAYVDVYVCARVCVMYGVKYFVHYFDFWIIIINYYIIIIIIHRYVPPNTSKCVAQ